MSIVIFLPIGLVVTDRFAPKKDKVETSWGLKELLEYWSRVSFEMQSLRDNPDTAKEDYLSDIDIDRKGLTPQLTFSIPKLVKLKSNKPLQQRILEDNGFQEGGTNIHYLEKLLNK